MPKMKHVLNINQNVSENDSIIVEDILRDKVKATLSYNQQLTLDKKLTKVYHFCLIFTPSIAVNFCLLVTLRY